MALDLIQQSFSGGEWSPDLDQRSDLEKYYSACRLLENMFPTRYGPAQRRPGLKFVAEVKDSSKKTRLIPFKFSTIQAYILEYGDEYIRFYKDRGQILSGVGTDDISALDAQIAHWKLNETTGTAVDDAVAVVPNDGTASASIDLIAETGKVDGCFNLDGQYNITVPNDASLSFDDSGTNPFSIMAWGFVTKQNDLQNILSKWDETTGTVINEWRLSLDMDRKLQLHLSDVSTNISGNVVGQWKLNDNDSNTNIISSLPQYTVDGFTDGGAGEDVVTITGDGDLSSSFPNGSEFTIDGSAANDGQYSVVSTSFAGDPDFTINIATGSLTNTTVGGTVAPHAGVCSVNTDTIDETGKINGALNFGGSKYITVDDSANFSFDDSGTKPFSIAAWVYVTETVGDQIILSKWDTPDNREWIFDVRSSGEIELWLHDKSVGISVFRRSDSALATGWHFVVVTYDSSGGATAATGITLYVDSVAVASTATNNVSYVAMEDTTTKVAIGAKYTGGSLDDFWADKIDNVVLFDKVLTEGDVLGLYNSGDGKEVMADEVVSAISDDAITTGWHFLGATYSSPGVATAADGIILYVDGVAVNSTGTNNAGYTGMQAGAALVRIGAQESAAGAAEKFWGDKLDEISLFSDVLTPTEIASLYTTEAYEITSSYLEDDLFGIQRIQSADLLYNFHGSYNPRTLTRFEHALWEIDSVVFDWPAFMSENKTTTTITPSGTVGTIELASTSPIFTADHIGSSWLIRHNRTDNHIEEQFTEIATLIVLGDAADSYNIAGVSDILVDVKGSYRLRTSDTWAGTVILERSYDGILELVLDAAPAGGAWAVDDIITGGTSGNTCVIVTAIDTTHYKIKQLSGSFSDGEILTNQSGNARDTATSWPRYQGWHILETFQSESDQNFNAPGEEIVGDAYLRARKIAETPGADPTVTLSCERFYHYGIVKITGFSSSTLVTGTVTRNIGSTEATELWSEGSWSDERGYPSAGTFHEERLMLSGTNNNPNVLNGSKTDDWHNFRAGTLADDSVSYKLSSNEVNAIRWLISKEVLLMGTSGAEWKLGAFDSGEPLTPDNPTVPRVQTTYGSKDVQAIMLANIVLFVQQEGTVVRGAQYIFDKGESGGYDAPDYTTLANHITESGIVSMAYQQNPSPVLWCVLGNGFLIGMTFEPGEKVWGWFRVVTEGLFEDVAVSPGVSEDEIWCIVNRTIGGATKRNIEYFTPRDWGDDIADMFFVDSGLSFDGGDAVTITGITNADPCVVTATNTFSDGQQIKIVDVGGMVELNNKVFTVESPSTSNFTLRDKLDEVDIDSTGFGAYTSDGTAQQVDNRFSGLGHLEGKTVSVLGDGSVHADVVVTSGVATLTDYYNKVHIGLQYTSKLQPMKIIVPTNSGASNAKKKKISQLTFSFKDTVGCSFGTEDGAEVIDQVPFRKTTDPAGEAVPLFTGEKQQTFTGGYELSGNIFVKQEQPLPLTLRSITAELGIFG
jgi:hypothetical protein